MDDGKSDWSVGGQICMYIYWRLYGHKEGRIMVGAKVSPSYPTTPPPFQQALVQQKLEPKSLIGLYYNLLSDLALKEER